MTDNGEVHDDLGGSSATSDGASASEWRSESSESRIFDDELHRVVEGSDAPAAVKDRMNHEYSQDPSGYAAWLLANTTVPVVPRRSTRRVLRPILLAVGLVLLVAWTWNASRLLVGGDRGVGLVVMAGFLTICWPVLGWAVWSRRLTWSWIFMRSNDSRDAEAHYRDGVRTQVVERMNVVWNGLYAESLAAEEEVRRRAAEESAEVVLSTTEARRLVELDGADPMPVKALRDLQHFIASHVTSAIGISGPRGVGKTTIMRVLCREGQDRYVGVYVPAPVRYSPADFVTTIHQRTAEQIIKAHGAERHDPSSTGPNAVATVRIIGVLAVFLCAAAAFAFDWRPTLSGQRIVECGLAVVAAALTTALAVPYVDAVRTRRLRYKSPVALARSELQRLAWSSKTQTSSTNSLAWRGVSLEDRSMIELVERETSHLQRIDAFQKFATVYRTISDRTIVVGVDELDKISTPDEAP